MTAAVPDRARPGPLGRRFAAVAFGGYALLGRLATPLVRRHLRQRLARGKEEAGRLDERLGRAGVARPAGPLIWIHGASVGEAQSALPLIERLRRDWPGFAILVTSGTVTSAKLMAARLPAGVIHQYVPVDLPGAVDAFLDHWQPQIGLIVESEFWPNLLRGAAARGTRLVLLNGRVSADSYRDWQRARPLIAELLGCFSLITARAPEDRDRLMALGAGQVASPGDLKAAAPPLTADAAELGRLQEAVKGRALWLAASTHAGEERLVGETQRTLAARIPGLLTLLAPRHPSRAGNIRRELEALGLKVACRSQGEPIVADTDVYLADTIGELGLWLRLAEIVFVGGSLVAHGGQNLLEPAKLGCAILAGPHTANFARLAAEMTAAGALREVGGPAALTAAVADLQAQPAQRQALAAAAHRYAEAQAGVLDRVMTVLTPLLQENSGTAG
ncbi:MAG: 3-deoxy-D-manno-octulosonic acid transferase [Kiloniellaceae bacterium]